MIMSKKEKFVIQTRKSNTRRNLINLNIKKEREVVLVNLIEIVYKIN